MSGTTVEELKSLYVKFGGNIEDVADLQTDAELIDKLEDIYEAGASLPEVTADDNGDILGVVEGAWAKMDAPTELPSVSAADNGNVLAVVNGAWAKAEKEVYIFKGTFSGNNEATLNLPNGVTGKDLYDLVNAGKEVILIGHSSAGENYLYKIGQASDTGVVFYLIEPRNNGITFKGYTVGTTSTTSAINKNITIQTSILPMVNSADNDKILKVVNGVWTAVTP